MAIGTTVKVGYDGKAVERGLGGLRSGFMGLGRVINGRLGLGGIAKTVGAITALGVGFKAISGFKEMADYAGGLTDMATQTGMTIEKLVELEEAIRLAGVPARDASMILSRFAANMQEAANEAGPARDAFNKLGLWAPDLRGAKIDTMFDVVIRQLRRIKEAGGDAESIVEDLFGARIGYGLLRLTAADMEKAARNTKEMARDFARFAPELDTMADDLGGLAVQFRAFYLGIYKSMQSVFGDSPLQKMFEIFNYNNAGPFFEKLRNTMLYIRQEGLGNLFEGAFDGLGEKLKTIISEGVSEGLKGGLNPFSGFGFGKDKSTAATDVGGIEDNTARTARILEQIARNKPETIRFA